MLNVHERVECGIECIAIQTNTAEFPTQNAELRLLATGKAIERIEQLDPQTCAFLCFKHEIHTRDAICGLRVHQFP